MTELLSRLLHDEATDLVVPPAPLADVLARGRRVRRARTRLRVVGVSCLVAACAVGLLAVRERGGDRQLDGELRIAETSRAMAAYVSDGAYSVDDELVIGANRFDWPERIKALHYTSAGVVVQSGENPDRDEGGSRYALVTPTGEWSPIDVTLDDQVAGFETGSTHFAYAEPSGTGYDLVVHDAASDVELARQHVDLGRKFGGWRAPPVAIHGDLVWVHGELGWTQWNWGSGVVQAVPGTASTYEVGGGVWADWQDRERWLIRSTADSGLVRELDLRPGWYGFLSPDGRYLRAFPNLRGSASRVDYEFFSVATGKAWQLRDLVESHDRVELGWSPDGHVLQLVDDTLSTCDPDTGVCTVTATDVGAGSVRLGGEPYGS